ncbi:MAG: tetratricopeptide repeat protein [Alphaproteobacteria bacterium]|nr:tetratricopeptide repeat protein [Alphaproteobacteria bacterium]
MPFWPVLIALLTSARADTPVDVLPEGPRATFEQAEVDWADGDLEAALDGFSTVTVQAPTFDRAWRRRCGVLLGMGQVDEALSSCRHAVELVDGYENHTALALVLLQSADDEDDGTQAAALIQGVVDAQPDYLPGWVAACTYASAHEAPKVLARCAEALQRLAPETPGTLFYTALQRADDGDIKGATEALRHAQELGLTDDLYARGSRAIAAQAKVAPVPGAAKKAKEEASSWSLGDLMPLLIVAALVMAVGVLAFGKDEDEDAAN